MVVIYGLACPIKNQVRYVGKSVDVENRYINHMCCKKNTHVYRWINKLKSSGLAPYLIVLEYNPDDWKDRERFWIQYFKNKGNRLTNLTNGGDGIDGYTPSEETKRKTSNTMKKYKKTKEHIEKIRLSNKGQKRSKEFCQKISKIKKEQKIWLGRKHSEESKKKMSIAATGRKHTVENKIKMSKSQKELYNNGYINPFKGRCHTKESRAKLGRRKGWHHTLEIKEQIRRSMLKYKNNKREEDSNGR